MADLDVEKDTGAFCPLESAYDAEALDGVKLTLVGHCGVAVGE